MNDLISKYDVLEICKEQIWNGADDYYPISANKIAKKVKELPTIDAVPVIRCCDCVHFKYLENQFVQMTRCVVHDRCPDYTDFCSWAERKEE